MTKAPDYIRMSRLGLFVCLENQVTFRTGESRDSLSLDDIEAALLRYKATGKALGNVPSLAKQWALKSAIANTDGASTTIVSGAPVGEVAEANVGLAGSMVDDKEGMYLENTMMVIEVEKTGLRGQL